MYSRLFLTLVLSSLLIIIVASCGDDITNIYYTNTEGAVFGNVVPADSGTALLHGLAEYQTEIDANGYFNFAQVDPGAYTLELSPQNHGRRKLSNVIVGTGVTAQYRQTMISEYPFPIFRSVPTNGATSIYTGNYITITSSDYLNLDDLNSLTTFNPPVQGSWFYAYYYYENYEDEYNGVGPKGFNYSFHPAAFLIPGTDYSMTISKDAHTQSGESFDDDLQLGFETREFYTFFEFNPNRLTGRVSRRGFHASVRLYLCASADSVAKAIHFEPDIPGIWRKSDRYAQCADENESQQHDFLATDLPLLPHTTYTAIVDARPFGLIGADTATFETEGYEVLDVRPVNGYYNVPVDNQVLAIFNEPMDTVSVRQAFSVTKVGGEAVPGTFEWNEARTEVFFSHWDTPYTIGSYTIKITTEAKTAEGENLDVGWESVFQVIEGGE